MCFAPQNSSCRGYVVFFAVIKGHRVHHHMIVQVRLIQVRADDHLVAVAKQTPANTTPMAWPAPASPRLGQRTG